MWTRFRVALARRLLIGSGCTITRAAVVEDIQALAKDLQRYVETSGGLNDPRRIKAFRKVIRGADRMEVLSRAVEAAA